jgi:hypothetical protein
VNWTGLLAKIDWGSALAIVRVYMFENLGNLEEITGTLLLKAQWAKWNYKLVELFIWQHINETRTYITKKF